jgi:hypothetical protein
VFGHGLQPPVGLGLAVQGHQGTGQARIGQAVEQALSVARVGHQVSQQADEHDVAGAVQQQRLAATRLVDFGADQLDHLLQRPISTGEGHHHGLLELSHQQRRHGAFEVGAGTQQRFGRCRALGLCGVVVGEGVGGIGTADHHGRGLGLGDALVGRTHLHAAREHQVQPQAARGFGGKQQRAVVAARAHDFDAGGQPTEQGGQPIEPGCGVHLYELQIILDFKLQIVHHNGFIPSIF